MIFIWLSPLFIAVNVYYIFEICKWLTAIGKAIGAKKAHGCSKVAAGIIKAVKITYGVLWSIATLSVYIAFLMPSDLSKDSSPVLYGIKRILKLIGNYHMGVFIYMGIALLVILLCRLLELLYCRIHGKDYPKTYDWFDLRRSILGVVYVCFVVLITLLGVYKAGDIKTNYYDVTVNKSMGEMSDMTIVLVADLHLGYNIGCEQMEKMVNLINAEDPDVVLVAGDIFDNEYEALDDPEHLIEILSSINSKYGVYACYGNHDVSERIIGGFTFDWENPAKGSSDEMDEFLKQCGFKLLTDEFILLEDSVYIYGRPDYEKPGKTIITRKTPSEVTEGLDMTKPIIVMDHEPRELQELSDAGVDIDLCGHTHDGQFFPMNLTSRYFTWENSAGLLKKGNMSNIVTSGVGLFGPNIRIGTRAEICVITVRGE